MKMLEGKTVLITGAGKSLGRTIAMNLGKLGANVAVNYNSSDKGAKEVSEAISELGCKSIPVQADVSDSESVQKMFQEVVSELGSVDILVNNAAINIDSSIRKMTDDTWNRVLEVCQTGTFNCAREAIPAMRESGWGRIVNFGSIASYLGVFGAANYAASKAAIIGFTKSLAREVARYNITANVIAPGYIDIGMTHRLPEKMQEGLLEQIPMGRLGQPDEIAATVAFLVSQGAAYITGQVIHVNGGLYF